MYTSAARGARDKYQVWSFVAVHRLPIDAIGKPRISEQVGKMSQVVYTYIPPRASVLKSICGIKETVKMIGRPGPKGNLPFRYHLSWFPKESSDFSQYDKNQWLFFLSSYMCLTKRQFETGWRRKISEFLPGKQVLDRKSARSQGKRAEGRYKQGTAGER